MVGIAGAAALRAGYLRKGLAYMLIEALRQEGVEPTQPVEGVGDVDQTRLYPSVQESAIDGLCGHDLAHVADVNRSGGGNAGGDGMGARAFQLLGDDIRPVNRHVPQSMQGGDIKLPCHPLRARSLIESLLSKRAAIQLMPSIERPGLDEYFMEIAIVVAKRSTCSA